MMMMVQYLGFKMVSSWEVKGKQEGGMIKSED